MEPHGARERDRAGEERLEGERDADHVDDVAEVHRVSRPRIDAGFDQPLGRRAREPRPAAAERNAVAAAKPVLQIAPQHERQKNRPEAERAEDRELPYDRGERQQQECLYRRFSEPAVHYSAFAPARRITAPHLSVSARMNAANSTGLIG